MKKLREIEVDQLFFDVNGRGLYAHGDNSVVNATQTTKGSLPWVSGLQGDRPSSQIFPVPSSMGWLKITWMSGSAGAVASGWIPIFSGNITNI